MKVISGHSFSPSVLYHTSLLSCVCLKTSGEKVASFDAAMDALRQASSPVPVVFHRPIPETAVNKDAHFSIEEGGDKPRASASIRVEGEGAGGTGGTEEEDMEERPDANWRIVHIG